MNWKLRFKNKATLIAIVAAAVAFVYQILGILHIVPPITEEQVMQVLGIIINILVGLGILVDPTTAGIGDSARAMTYSEPGIHTIPDDGFLVGGEGDYVFADEHEQDDPDDVLVDPEDMDGDEE
jgi:phi LC3 family holin